MNVTQNEKGWWVATIKEIGYEGYWLSETAANLAIDAYNKGISDHGSINRYVNTRRADGMF